MRGTGSLLDSEKVITSVGTSLREFVCNTVTVSRNRHFLTQKCQAGRRHTEAKHGYDIELAGSVTRRHKITLFSSPSLCLCLYLPRYLSLFFVLCTLFSLFVCLFVFFPDFILILRGQAQVFSFIIKAHAGSGYFLCKLPIQQEKGIRGCSLKTRLYVLLAMVFLRLVLLSFLYCLSAAPHPHVRSCLQWPLIYRESTRRSRA